MTKLERETDMLPDVMSDIKKADSASIERSPIEAGNEQDGIHDDLVLPTEEEKRTLRRVSDAIPWNAYLIAFIEFAERFSYYGTIILYTNFIMQPLPEGSRTGAGGEFGQSGALGLGQRTMIALTTFNSFWAYVAPLFGAYLADTYWGRYKTICVGLAVSLLGHVLLIVCSVPGVIDSKGAIGAFIIAVIIMGIGTGMFKANISPLVAEQYKTTKMFVIISKGGERVIVDPTLTHGRIYMYFYLLTNLGGLIGTITMVYAEKFVGFYLAFTLPTVILLCCPFVLYITRNQYVTEAPTGSVLATAFRAWKFCASGKWSLNPVRTWKNFRAPGFWDPIKSKHMKPQDRKPWMTFDDVWVDELQRSFQACGVFCWYPLYWLTYFQLNSNLVAQAAAMNTHGLPNDILVNLDPLAVVIFIPIFDQIVYPGLRWMGFNITSLKKMTVGFFTASAAIIWAAVVQHYLYKTSPCGAHAASCRPPNVSPLNVWIQTGAYVLIAISEILASITGLEYAFTKAPKNMRSLIMAAFLFTLGIASAIGQAFVPLSADPLLVWNYGSMAVIAFITGVVFWLSVRGLDAREDELNSMAAGKFGDKEGRSEDV
ncbi:hypothetical protein CVT24_000342 [Panaeolus cyanescens]|uniref:Major facilitator superfamily (MFS) profile domain-containing protein n=1 Tax=Panaeolus cyanescens TaxID=181874 RepID=A0A409YD03_9AGAR|nr:hypothetical protein CVT24_000342 [Panaeolus cyanescens]